MNEKVLNKSKNGMAVLILVIALYILAFFILVGAGFSYAIPGAVRGLLILKPFACLILFLLPLFPLRQILFPLLHPSPESYNSMKNL